MLPATRCVAALSSGGLMQVLRLGDSGGAVADQAVVALLVRRFCGLVARPAVGAGNDWFA